MKTFGDFSRLLDFGICGLSLALKGRLQLAGPIHAQIEPTNKCNLDCKMCFNNKLKSRNTMTFKEFKKIINKVSPKYITLQGWGEPFLNPDFFNMIKYAKKKDIKINTTTNGTFLRKKRREILQSGLHTIQISIDSATPETYRKIRVKNKFSQIVDGIKDLKRGRGNSPTIKFNFIVLPENKDEIPLVIDLASELDVKEIYFTPPIQEYFWKKSSSEKKKLFSAIKAGYLESRKMGVQTNLDKWIKKYEEYWNKITTQSLNNSNGNCYYPWLSIYITSDGSVKPCYNFFDCELSFGNIFRGKMEEIWNGEKYLSFRKKLLEGETPEKCKSCDSEGLKDLIKKLKSIYYNF